MANNAPQIPGRFRSVPASRWLKAIGDSLEAIKNEDELTDVDLGEELGKGDDQAGRYRTGLSDMPATTLLRAFTRWNGRFANPILALAGLKLVPLEVERAGDAVALAAILQAAQVIATELAGDGDVSDGDLKKNRQLIERVGAIFDGYRERLKTA